MKKTLQLALLALAAAALPAQGQIGDSTKYNLRPLIQLHLNGADFIGRPGTVRRFRIPRPTRYGVVHVRPEGARLVEYHVDRDTFTTFLEARRLFAWREAGAKSVIGETVVANTGTEAA
jgi:hypothetical protein